LKENKSFKLKPNLNSVILKIDCETLLLNGKGYGGFASSALWYYQITRPTKLSLEIFTQAIGVVGLRIICLIAIY
jgi:hypothetical protein